MIDIPVGLPAELVPLSWLIGVWEGDGVVDYRLGDDRVLHEFHQRIEFRHGGGRYLDYVSTARVEARRIDAEPDDAEPADAGVPDPALAATTPADDARLLVTETGYWSLERPLVRADQGPAMLPAVGEHPYPDADAVETLRNDAGGFDISATIVHPDGIGESYAGSIQGPRIDLSTHEVMRAPGAKEYTTATRMYGLVDAHLLWAWDIAALGHDLRTHASARLAKAD